MHIAVVSIGAYGHIFPTLPFVTELVRRGVRVTYFSTEDFRDFIEPTGAAFVPVKSWMAEHASRYEKEAAEHNDIVAVVPFLFLSEADAYIDDILAVLNKDRPDAIVHDFAAIAGTIAADVLKVPNIMLYTSVPANETFSVAKQFEHISPHHPLRQAVDELAQYFTNQYGCKKLSYKEIFDGHGDFNIVLMQKRFVPNGDSFGSTFVFTGAQIGKRAGFEHWTAPDNDRPLIYSSFGSVFNQWQEYYPILFDAVRDLEVNVYAATGSVDPESLDHIPDNVQLAKAAPQLEVLANASIFITHAGTGSTGEAIYYGVPMIAIPQMDEQKITAAQIESNGLGITFMDKTEVTSDSLKSAIETLLNDPSYRQNVNEFSEDMKSLGGAAATADAIMAYVSK